MAAVTGPVPGVPAAMAAVTGPVRAAAVAAPTAGIGIVTARTAIRRARSVLSAPETTPRTVTAPAAAAGAAVAPVTAVVTVTETSAPVSALVRMMIDPRKTKGNP